MKSPRKRLVFNKEPLVYYLTMWGIVYWLVRLILMGSPIALAAILLHYLFDFNISWKR